MTQATATLVEFLLARIAEDEEAAHTASPGGRWQVQRRGIDGHALVSLDEHAYELPDYPACVMDDESGGIGPGVPTMRYIARWGPSRVLAECEAKRRIVEQYAEYLSTVRAYRSPRWSDAMNEQDKQNARQAEARHRVAEDMARLLALPYASHPDYRQEWRP